MRLCIDKEEAIPHLEGAHIDVGNIHLSPNQTLKKIKRMGVYWPTMYKDVHEHIKECTCQWDGSPVMHNDITLYKMSPIAPKWVEAMVEYMTTM